MASKKTTDKGARLQVELDVFSGRPNPTFQLEGAEAARLANATRAALDGESVHRHEPPALGYRGFRLTDPEKRTLPAPVRVYGRVVECDGRCWMDRDELEEKLLKAARGEGLGGLIDAFRATG